MSNRRGKWRWSMTICALVVISGYGFLTGPRDLDRYPARESSPYRLPWPAGTAYFCAQSNRGIVSHRGGEEYAYDFYMPVGSPVCAARAGVISKVQVSRDGRSLSARNNHVCVDHEDGTRASYLHLRKGGSRVRVGEHVGQGQIIASSGNVGRSLAPHLHFEVEDQRGRLMRVSFSDVKNHRGIPRMFFRYRSGNAAGSVDAR
jgi:murein DD-endopeptidase MepM/ murein hydrolase activator NlpD